MAPELTETDLLSASEKAATNSFSYSILIEHSKSYRSQPGRSYLLSTIVEIGFYCRKRLRQTESRWLVQAATLANEIPLFIKVSASRTNHRPGKSDFNSHPGSGLSRAHNSCGAISKLETGFVKTPNRASARMFFGVQKLSKRAAQQFLMGYLSQIFKHRIEIKKG